MARLAQIPFFRSLRFKIGFGNIVLVAITIAVSIWTMYNFEQLYTLEKVQGQAFQDVIVAENMARAVERHHHAISALLNRDILNSKIEFTQAKEDFFLAFTQANRFRKGSEADSILENIGSTYEGFMILSDSLIAMAQEKKVNRAKQFYYNDVTPFLERLSDNCFWLVELNQKQMVLLYNETQKITSQSIIGVTMASIFAVILSFLTLTQFFKRIITPAEHLMETVHQIGRGRLDLKTDVKTNDEIGELSREFNKMTERLRQFEALNIETILQEKQKSEAIVSNINDSIIVCDAEGRVRLINHSAESFLHVAERDAVGKPLAALTSNELLLEIFNDPDKFHTSRQPYFQFQVNGKSLFFRPQISVLPSRIGVVLVLQDVTQFHELDRMKSDFMATVSHEFRTPLTSINIGVDILRQHLLGPLTRPQDDLLDSFKQDCNRLTKLVRELLQLSKLESGKLVQREERIDLRHAVDQVVQPLQLQFDEKKVQMRIDCDAEVPFLMGDEQHLSWVVSNLVSNALRHTPPEGRVTVEVRGEGESVLLRVSDTGEGIPPEFLDKIFDKFVQIKQSTETTPGSVGLGLAIAKDIVEMYGGKIWVESTVGTGSVFTVRLPATQENVP